MINPAPHIRKAFFALLNGNVNYDSKAVPVFDTEGTGGRYQILIAEQSDSAENTRNSFAGTFYQLIEVVAETPGLAARRSVDEIGDMIMKKVIPSPGVCGLQSSEFQFIGIKKASQNYIVEDGANGSKIVRLLIRYQFRINQINY